MLMVTPGTPKPHYDRQLNTGRESSNILNTIDVSRESRSYRSVKNIYTSQQKLVLYSTAVVKGRRG
jgi:hypothetical protein